MGARYGDTTKVPPPTSMDWWSLETLHITSYVDKDKCAKSEVKQNLERQFDITTTGSSVMNIAQVIKQSS